MAEYNSPTKVSEVKTVVATQPRKDKFVTAAKNAKVSTVAFAKTSQEKCAVIIKNPHFQTVTFSTASGAVTLGSIGGALKELYVHTDPPPSLPTVSREMRLSSSCRPL